MADTRTPEQRSRIMKAVRTADTDPELAIRRILYAAGFRYRVRAADLPGRPDIVMRGRKKAIFVHGCFWHGHGCRKGRLPKSRLEYWAPKIEQNRARDARVVAALESMGWTSLTVWQCELADPSLNDRLIGFVENSPKPFQVDGAIR